MDLVWITDPHLNFLPAPGASRAFGQALCQERTFDAVIFSGDIGEAPSVGRLLEEFAQGVAPRPVYFVLGNHDYYRSSFGAVKAALRTGFEAPNLVWLDEAGPIVLDGDTALVGHQGWYDGRAGDAEHSRVIMSDFEWIADLRAQFGDEASWLRGSRSALLAELHRRGTEAASQVKGPLLEALRARRTVLFVTHFPPFEGASWFEGRISDRHWLPWCTCHAMGLMLSEAAREHPECRILALCGHTHSPGVYEHAPNLKVLTGRSAYGTPCVSSVLTTPIDWELARIATV